MKTPMKLDTMIVRIQADSAAARTLLELCMQTVAPIKFLGSLFIINSLEEGRTSTSEAIGEPYVQVELSRLQSASEPAVGEELRARPVEPAPIPMLLTCPICRERHLDEGKFATKPHHTHACQHCGTVWRPALVPTVGVRFLPGFKNL